MAENSIFLIDIDKVLKDKAGEKAKKIPRFVVSFLKRIVHQDEVNAFLTRTADKSGVDFLEACMEYLDIKLEVEGIENLPSEGLCTFVSNHPLGGQDGVALGYVLGKHYGGRIKYLVNDLLMNLRLFAFRSTRRVPSRGISPEWWKPVSVRMIISLCFRPVCVRAVSMELSKICPGRRHLS